MTALPRIVALLAGALLLLGCQEPRGTGGRPPVPALGGTSWRLISVSQGGSTWEVVADAAPPTLAFEDDAESGGLRLSGFGGVNRYFGSCTITSSGDVSVGPLGATRMAGPPELMELEDAFLAAVGGATSCEVTPAGELMLSGAGGTALLARE